MNYEKLAIETIAPQIKKLQFRNECFEIAMPEIHRITFAKCSPRYLFKLPDNSYSNILGTLVRHLSSSAEPANYRADGYFQCNKNLHIKSFRKWHELTQKNPNFMIEQFDPIYYSQCNPDSLMHINPRVENLQFVPFWLPAAGKIPEKISISPPRTRSIFADTWDESNCLQMAFPKIAFVQFPDSLLCLINTRHNTYVPFEIANVDLMGFVCLGAGYSSKVHDPIDYFWNSRFDHGEISLQISPNLVIHSNRKWQKLTERNPNFMREQLDPDFLERRALVLYNIDGNNFSRKFQ